MLFTSLEFILLFLPIVLIGYFALRRELRNAWLLLASLVFYAWGEPRFVVVMMASIAINYFIALVLEACREHGGLKRLALSVGILANLSLIFLFKYANFVTATARSLFPEWQGVIPQTHFILPIGISFFTFQAISYLIDVGRGVPAQKNPVNIALYIALFPQLVAGPIVRYESVSRALVAREETLTGFADGIYRFVLGFNKKMLLANVCAITADKCFASSGLTVCGAWLGAVAYTFQIFFDFSGYSDMAIGLGKIFGFTFPENFNYPYVSRSVTEFWRRWHISLSSWFRDYLYFPLGGSRVGRGRLVFNLAVVWLATGVWHGANWTFIIWGVLHGTVIIVEKLAGIPGKIEKRRPLAFAGWAATAFFFVVGWVLFRSENLSAACSYLAAMFGFGAHGLLDAQTIFEGREVCVVMAAAACASIPWVPALRARLESRPSLLTACAVAGRAAQYVLFLVSVSFLVMDSHNPFIYFNF